MNSLWKHYARFFTLFSGHLCCLTLLIRKNRLLLKRNAISVMGDIRLKNAPTIYGRAIPIQRFKLRGHAPMRNELQPAAI